MDKKLFEELLWQPESDYLDFKAEQHKFPKGAAGDVPKSELLKDILGMANARRDRVGYIITGVKEKPGERAELLGIPKTDHFDDAELQQFVDKKTNKTIDFGYIPFEFDGLHFGVYRIPPQHDLFYLETDYGKLAKLLLYMRIGTSINPLTPEQIYDMGVKSVVRAAPSFKVELYDWDTKQILGTKAAVKVMNVKLPANIPDFRRKGDTSASGLARAMYELTERTNPSYFRDMLKYITVPWAYKAFGVAVTNTGTELGTGVHWEIKASHGDVTIKTGKDMPEQPESTIDRLLPYNARHFVPALQPMLGPRLSVYTDTANKSTTIFCNTLTIQPGKCVMLEPRFLIGADKSKVVKLTGELYGDTIRKPVPIAFEFDFTVMEKSPTVPELGEILQHFMAQTASKAKDEDDD